MKLLILFSLLFSAIIANQKTNAQERYKTAIGVKGGYPGFGSINLKHFFTESVALELTAGGSWYYVWLQGLVEKNFALGEGFDWYVGAGADVGSYSSSYNYYYGNNKYNGGLFVGFTGVLGLEYTFADLPLNVAFDIQPRFRFLGNNGRYFGGGFALRYVLK